MLRQQAQAVQPLSYTVEASSPGKASLGQQAEQRGAAPATSALMLRLQLRTGSLSSLVPRRPFAHLLSAATPPEAGQPPAVGASGAACQLLQGGRPPLWRWLRLPLPLCALRVRRRMAATPLCGSA